MNRIPYPARTLIPISAMSDILNKILAKTCRAACSLP
jgi:hypothetical protein